MFKAIDSRTLCNQKHDDIFDRVRWPTMWVALGEQGVPEHFVRLLVSAYDEQLGEVMGEWGKNGSFPQQ